MNKVKALFAAVKRSPKMAALVAAIAGAVIVPAALMAWGPVRATFTMAHPATYVTFDSITDNPVVGDERNFVTIREVGTTGTWNDTQNVEAGKSYMVRAYVHNNASSNLNLVARNVTAMFNLPTVSAKSIEVQGFITSSNANPQQVYDHATFTSNQNFSLQYQSGSLEYTNNAFPNGTALPESIFTSTGAKLGYNQMDGNIPGCTQYSGWISFVVTPKFPTTPTNNLSATKQVRKTGDTAWQKSVNVNPGDSVDYQISYKNTGNTTQNNVNVKDSLPAGMTYVAGSTKVNGVKADDGVTSPAGLNIGSYQPGATATITFSAKVDDKTFTCGTKLYTNKVRVTANGDYREDTADVHVAKPCVGQITVCDLATKQIVTIKETDFDSSKYSKNTADCAETPAPSVLPETGINTGVMAFVGLGVSTAAVAYAATSDRVRALLRR